MVEKNKFKDPYGRLITQSLFIDFQYNEKFAVYTLEDHDKEYNGKIYPSLKRLYLEEEDIHEYNFATKHLYSWDHWKRLLNNKAIREHIDRWRDELEVAMAASGFRKILELADQDNYQAAKYIADRGWNSKRGRPSKEEIEREKRIRERISDEFSEDAERMNNIFKIK